MSSTDPQGSEGGRGNLGGDELSTADRIREGETIVGISTVVGSGAVGIVRVSGAEAMRLAGSVFRAPSGREILPDETFSLVYGHVVEPGTEEVIDEALLAIMRGPRSYTREDVIELQCHGGAAAVRAVLGLMVRLGARIAEPGEFTRRAFLNGRIDLAQAESVVGIVAARSSAALRAAVRQLDGGLSERVRKARGELVGMLASIEAAVDFADEDVEDIDEESLKKGLTEVQESLAYLLETALAGRVLEEGVRTAIVGRPNAGKSSLLNALVMRERAIVSEIPGTTRDTVEEHVEIGGIPIRMVDTAGLRVGGDQVEKMGVERSRKAMEEADLVLAVIDLDSPWGEEDQIILGRCDAGRWIVVGSKSDLVDDPGRRLEELGTFVSQALDADRGSQREGSEETRICAVSAVTGDGIDGLRALVYEVITGERKIHLEEAVLANERQRSLVEAAAQSVSAGLSGLSEGKGEELICEDIRSATKSLGEITGEELTPDLLDEIFSRFCLGK